ncbi:glycosyl hydrolase family 28-related protein, partial [Streptomyces monticola]
MAMALGAGLAASVLLPMAANATGGGSDDSAGAGDKKTSARATAAERGAAVPYAEYEAEDGTYEGTLLEAEPERPFGHTNFATESSGRKSVRLNSAGQYVEFTSKSASNSIVVRNSIPDAAGGGGQEKTLSLYADGKFVQKIKLSSKHSWLYGNTDQPEGLTNTPGGDARRLFDESHALLKESYPEGTKFRLQRDEGDDAEYYVVDLVDLEQVAPPAEKPADCTSITEYGAVPDDGKDDTTAIQKAVTADQNGTIECVWIPAGQWRQEQKILTDDPQDRGDYNQVGIKDV